MHFSPFSKASSRIHTRLSAKFWKFVGLVFGLTRSLNEHSKSAYSTRRPSPTFVIKTFLALLSQTFDAQIIKLYDRVAQEGPEPDHIPADLVHHFMLAICTRPGTGVCFRDQGWYPRVSDTDDGVVHGEEELKSQRGGKIHNIILANILKTLKINEDPRQQELSVKVMEACPELVSGSVTPLSS
jgi:hypothetical protein